MHADDRDAFDEILEAEMAALPEHLHRMIEEVPVVVEDHPSDEVMDEMGVEYLDDLCGLHTGIPLTEKSVMHSGELPDVITLYREGIMSAAADDRGEVDPAELRRQVRITLLHEIGHQFGLDEDDLRELGYE